MAYQALYRTFRPSTLGELVRQEHIVRILTNQIETGRIGHAYLFCGPRGTGKTSTAKIFARAINCLHPKGGSPCGACEVCRALADPANLDISEIDAASNNGVNEMRDLREKVQYPPVSGKYKVYIVDEVHMLSDSAFNALLKTLEEPPAHAVFILATTEPQKLPATILSRCMRFDFKLIPQKDIEERLKAVLSAIGKQYEDEAVAAIARAGAGSMRDSLSVAEMCVSYSKGKLTYADVNEVLGSADFYDLCKLGGCVLAGQAAEAVSAAEAVLASGKSAGMLAKDLLTFFHRCTVAKTCKNGAQLLNLPAEMYAALEKVSAAARPAALVRCCELFAGVETDLRYSTSPRIVLETALVRACLPETEADAALLRRIEALEAKVSALAAGLPAQGMHGQGGHEGGLNAQGAGGFAAHAAVERGADADGYAPHGFVPDDEEAPPEEFFAAAHAAPARAARGEARERAYEGVHEEARPARGAQNALAPENRAKAFAYFIRALRSGARNGVLFAMCQDLESGFEGDTFVLTTDSETIYKRLQSPENHESVRAALEKVGIADFSVRLKGQPADNAEDGLEALKKNFPDADIEVRR